MAVSYKKLFKLLIDRDMKKKELNRKKAQNETDLLRLCAFSASHPMQRLRP